MAVFLAPSRLRVDVATGTTHVDAVDVVLPGPIPLVLARRYRSAGAEPGVLGAGWSLGLDAALRVGDEAVTVVGGSFDGVAFAPVAMGRSGRQETTGFVLEHLADAYVLSATPRRQLVFLKRHARGDRIPLSAVRDGAGQALVIERSGGLVSAVRDPLGRTLTFEYAGDRLSGVDLVAPPQQPVPIARYTHAGGTLKSAAGPDGRAEQFDASSGLITAHRSRSGGQTYAQYDADGRCLALWSDGEFAFRLDYDTVRHTTRVLDAGGGQTLYRHVLGRQVLERIDPAGASHTYYYDESERLIGHGTAAETIAFQRLDPGTHRLAHLDREGRVLFVQYHETGLAERAEDAFKRAFALTWDDTNALVGMTDPGGGTWAFDRDAVGRVAAVTSPEARTVRLRWERDGLAAETAEGTLWREEWDAQGRLLRRSDRAGRRQQRQYHPDGRLAEVRFDGGYSVAFVYDLEGHLTGVADSERTQTRADRDASGRMRRASDPSGRRFAFDYDASGRIVAAHEEGAATLHLRYAEDGRLSRTDGRGAETAYGYEGGQTTVTDSHGSRRYSLPGDLVEWSDPRGARVTFQYGPAGELMTWERSQEARATGYLVFEYGACGRLSALSGGLPDPSPTVEDEASDAPAPLLNVGVGLAYDGDGWLTGLQDGDGREVQIQHDALGQPIRIEGLAVPVLLAFDLASRLVRVDAGDDAVEIEYDDLDRPLVVRQDAQTHPMDPSAPSVWDQILVDGSAQPPSDDAPDEEKPAGVPLSLRVEPHGVALFAWFGPLAVPIWSRAELRSPDASPSVRIAAVAVRGPSAALARPSALLDDVLSAWLPGADRDVRADHAAVPRSRDLGGLWPVLDESFLDASPLETTPVVAGAVPRHQPDTSRDPFDALTGPHRRGVLRPAPWRSRSARALLPRPDLLAPDGAPSARDVLTFLTSRG